MTVTAFTTVGAKAPPSAKTLCVLYPAFSDEADLANNLYRAVWYLAGILRDGGLLLVPRASPVKAELPLPSHLDPEIENVFRSLRSRIVSCAPEELPDFVKSQRADSHLLLCHKESARDDLAVLASTLPGAKVARVDPENTQYESSFYLRATSNDGAGTTEDVRVCRERFREMTAALDGERVFIFGTGPSLDTLDFTALPRGEKIVTNSMVVNKEMMASIRPRLIVASDPIFHAGCSSYAGEFRQHLVHAMREYGSYFVFPMRDYSVYETHLPTDLSERLIGIPLVGSEGLNHSLHTSFCVSSTQNVMTLFLLPISASISKNVVLAGFDGRPISKSSYFWSHSRTAQLHHRMDEIKAAHPAFFKLSYNEYLFRHMRCVARYLDEAEAAGVRITSLTDSHVPSIKGRFVEGDLQKVLGSPRPKISVIIPCFNAAKSLPSSLASVFDQSFPELEIVCVDDGSTDDTFEVLSRYANMDDRIVVLRQKNSGVSVARNTALAAARGAYICFLDADDAMLPGSLKIRYAKAKEIGDDAIVVGTTVIQDANGDALNVTAGPGNADVLTFDQFDKWPAALHSGFGPAHLFKAARFRPGLAYCEDWLYFAEIARTGVRLVNCHAEVAAYRWHDSAATQRNFRQALIDTSTVFRQLTSDDWENEMLEPEFSPGLDPVVFHGIELKRMYDMLLQRLFRQDAAGLREICGVIERKARRRPIETYLPDDVERGAVRAFFKPFGSIALYARVSSELHGYRDTLEKHVDPRKHAVFFSAFRDFVTRVEGAGRTTPRKAILEPGLRKALYRRAKRLPLIGTLVVTLRNRWLGLA